MVVPAPEAHQVAGCEKGLSFMWADGCLFSGQRSGVTEEQFPQQFESVVRLRPLARFLMGGLQARSTHLETVIMKGGSVNV